MGPGRFALAAVAHVWLTWGAPVAKAPAEAPAVVAPTAAAPAAPAVAPPTVVAPTASAPPAPTRADSPAPLAAPATPPPQVLDDERPGTGKQVTAPPVVPSWRPTKMPAAQVQMGVPAPASGKPRGYLYKSWLFWTIAGGLVAGTAAITYAVTRPPPMPYYGNAGTIMLP